MHALTVTKSNLLFILPVLLTLSFISPTAKSFTISNTETSSSLGITGLFFNRSESGWGVNLAQQYGIIFATLYAYDSSGLPTWYVASNCVITADGCSGELYKVTAGSEITDTWNSANLRVNTVGTISFTFTDKDTGTMNFTINGVSGSKVIERQIWAVAPPPPYTKLDATGSELADSATSWSCVRDNSTGLIWEVKTNDGSIHHYSNTYRWGGVGAEAGAGGSYYPDWDSLVNGSNAESLCGYSDWRVPVISELAGLADNRQYPYVNVLYFPKTQQNACWSASAGSDSGVARTVGFADGYGGRRYEDPRNYGAAVRLVSDGQ
jgi:hypothetical protein